MKKNYLIITLIAGLLVSVQLCNCVLFRRIKIRENVFTVEIAITSEEKERGLGYRDSILWYHGMLFVFEKKGIYSFWMKGMRFPLDFLWIDGNKIVDIIQKVPVPTGNTLPIYKPKVPVDRVLELNAGVVENMKISIGDTIQFLDK